VRAATRWLSFFISLSAALSACDRPPTDLREWKPDDHDRAESPQNRQVAPAKADGQRGAAANPTLTLVEVTWRNQCAACHGAVGRGDGPQGPMVHAPNLTLADWQAKVSDQQIARAIVTGKNKMPKFDFPSEVVAGLVARIRASKGR
jgi:cytochrome c oxidase cbb3-type subunit 3